MLAGAFLVLEMLPNVFEMAKMEAWWYTMTDWYTFFECDRILENQS